MPQPFRALLIACLLSAAIPQLPSAAAQTKPPLSAEIGAVIEAEGIGAAKSRFAEIYPARQDQYEVNVQDMMQLGQGYLQAGNMDAGMAVMEMMSTISADMSKAAMNSYSPEMAEMQQQARKADLAAQQQAARKREEEQRMRQQAEARSRGKARQDLSRFQGIYGDPGDPKQLRTVFVTVSCDGYLVTGPMWADVAPWWMRSAADTVFTYADSFTSFSMEFTGEGESTTMKHDLEGVESPLRWLSALPEGWGACLERPLQ